MADVRSKAVERFHAIAMLCSSASGRIDTVTKKPPFGGSWRALANQYIDFITIFRNS
jgi:hypothetical protein